MCTVRLACVEHDIVNRARSNGLSFVLTFKKTTDLKIFHKNSNFSSDFKMNSIIAGSELYETSIFIGCQKFFLKGR
jgi:hypothetical protein